MKIRAELLLYRGVIFLEMDVLILAIIARGNVRREKEHYGRMLSGKDLQRNE